MTIIDGDVGIEEILVDVGVDGHNESVNVEGDVVIGGVANEIAAACDGKFGIVVVNIDDDDDSDNDDVAFKLCFFCCPIN